LQSTERDEKKDIPPFYEKLIRKVKAPVMIDTTDPTAIELALTYCQGKAIINSINLEDGEEKFERVVPIAHEFGAAVVVGCIDEDKRQAQAFTRERKHGKNRTVCVHPRARARTSGKPAVFASAERRSGGSFECTALEGRAR